MFETQFRPSALLYDKVFEKVMFRFNETVYDSDDEDYDPESDDQLYENFPFCNRAINFRGETVATLVLEYPVAPDLQACFVDKCWSVHTEFVRADCLKDISHMLAWELFRDHFESFLYYLNRHLEHRLYKYQFPNSYKRTTKYRSNGGREIVCFYGIPVQRIWNYLHNVNTYPPHASEVHVLETNKPRFYHFLNRLLQIFIRHFRISLVGSSFVCKGSLNEKEKGEVGSLFKACHKNASALIFRWVDEIDRVAFGHAYNDIVDVQASEPPPFPPLYRSDDGPSSPIAKRRRLNHEDAVRKEVFVSLNTRLQDRRKRELEAQREETRQKVEKVETERDKQFFRPLFDIFLKTKNGGIPPHLQIEEMHGRHGSRCYHFVRRNCGNEVQYLSCALDLESMLQVLCQAKRAPAIKKASLAGIDYSSIFSILSYLLGEKFDLNMCFGSF